MLIPVLIALSIALGYMLSATLAVAHDYAVLVAPMSILVAALLAGSVTVNYLHRTEESRKRDRTVNFIASYDPFSRPDFINLLYAAERELADGLQVFNAAGVSGPELVSKIENLKNAVGDLSMEQAQAIHSAAGFFEMLIVNLSSDYFDKHYILQIYGDNFGIQFWARTWPLLKYSQLSNIEYQSLQGIPNNSLGGSYSSLERWVLSHVRDGDIFPMPNEKMATKKIRP